MTIEVIPIATAKLHAQYWLGILSTVVQSHLGNSDLDYTEYPIYILVTPQEHFS